ncbi:MAG TPA: hypothetical protein VG734_25025 [Lacunisphaera sp.]|nr:hypothetical protein [Lacunisphaera sp.]
MKPPRLSGYQIAFSLEETRGEREVFIYGDPAGLRSLAKLLLAVADLDQTKEELPLHDSYHVHAVMPASYAGHSAKITVGRADDRRGKKRFDVFPKPNPKKPIQPPQTTPLKRRV